MSSKTNIHVYFFANYFLDGIEISTIQIAKLYRFLSLLRDLGDGGWFINTGAPLRSPLPIKCRPFRAKKHKRPCHFFATDN